MDGMHVGRRLTLTNDDDPTSLSPRERTVVVIRDITDLLERCEHQPCRVFVSRYIGQSVVPPDRLSRQDLDVLFWGLITSAPAP